MPQFLWDLVREAGGSGAFVDVLDQKEEGTEGGTKLVGGLVTVSP